MITLASAFAERGYHDDLLVSRVQGPYLQHLPAAVKLIPLTQTFEGLMQTRSLLVGYHGVQALGVSLALIGASRYLPALVQYLQEQQPDALLSAKTSPNLAALWARRLTGVPTRIVVSEHTNFSQEILQHTRKWHWHWRFMPSVIHKMYPWADAIVAVSNGVADDLSVTTDLPRERITRIYNPVVTSTLQDLAHAPLDHPWFAPGSPPVILAAGRLAAQKDFPTLLKAVARVRAVREVRLLILGEGKERAALQSLARKLGIASALDLPGFVENPFAYMTWASMFVLSSAFEGLANVLIEAMACGCPVVSTDCPSGPREILAGGVYGPLVPVGDDAALAQAILATLDASPDRDSLRARAAEFSAEHAVERYLEVCWGREAHALV
jgi:glycosyltransferase involved in cell wall biosynthesis